MNIEIKESRKIVEKEFDKLIKIIDNLEKRNIDPFILPNLKDVTLRLECFIVASKAYEVLEENNKDKSLMFSLNGGYEFLKEVNKIHSFLFIELKNYIISAINYKKNNIEYLEVLNIFDFLKEHYKNLKIKINKEDAEKLFFVNYFSVLSNVKVLSSIIYIISFNEFSKKNIFKKYKKSKLLSKYYSRVSDKAIEFLTLREQEKVNKLNILLARENKVSMLKLFWYTKRYEWSVEKIVNERLK